MPFIRVCQECGYELKCKKPDKAPSNSYLNRKCPKCESEAFDYGGMRYEPTDDTDLD
jgi:hypothetical protein